MGKERDEGIGSREGIQSGALELTAFPGPFSQRFPLFSLFPVTTFTG